MRTHRRLLSILTSGLLLASTSATTFVAPRSDAPSNAQDAPAACTLLTAADASTALEQKSQPGKEFAGPTSCMWSADPAMSDSSRKVGVNTHSVESFKIAQHPKITAIKVEPVSGIGDEAFYEIYPNSQSPFIWVRKGNTAFSIRIVTQLKPKKPFTLDQEKSKDAVLAKAAVAKLK